MKRYFLSVLIILLIILSYFRVTPILRDILSNYKDNGVSYVSMVDSNYFYSYKYGKWNKEFIKGVNIGAGKPGSFPGELAITKEDYLRWFKEIGDMNANTIRVYTILNPSFYDALYEYNKRSIKPIYVMQGVWINEEDIAKLQDAYNPKITDRFKKDIKDTIDIIHGKAVIPYESGHASGTYNKDVSAYISAWILGIEWDPEFVTSTNEKNKEKIKYKGKYLFTKEASPFEAWLGEIGDFAINYETDKYKMQRPLSFTNWVTTDLLSHPNEPLPKEDKVSVNTEHIKWNKNFKPGMFASYHIYPYYPDFMNYQKEYATYRDDDGKINTYRAYLKDLKKEHSVPVLVAEFGIPASRGKAHEDIYKGFNQGDVDEKSQGDMDVSMLSDIYKEGYAGGLVFSWQDEWFKRTWNTMDFDLPDRRAYWSNPQTNEQQFGILAFDPGEKKSICYVDGEISEWKKDKPLVTQDGMSLYVKSDEKYIYLMTNVKGLNVSSDKILIAVDSIPSQGNTKWNQYGVSFEKPTDFLVVIDGKDNSRVLVDAYYDEYYNMYSRLKMVQYNAQFEKKDSGIFNPINLVLNRPLYLPQDKKQLPLSKYETGKLNFGDANPDHKEYNSLADFNINGDNIEIKIPWALFNVMDPSSEMIMGDLYKKVINPLKIDGINFGLAAVRSGTVINNKNINKYSWKQWEQPTYHERLKPSYYILQKAFKTIGVK